jgi:hypothetical protein
VEKDKGIEKNYYSNLLLLSLGMGGISIYMLEKSRYKTQCIRNKIKEYGKRNYRFFAQKKAIGSITEAEKT